MCEMRKSTHEQRMTIKAAFRRAVSYGGGVRSFQHATRVNAPALSKYGAPHEADYFAPVDVCLDIDLDIGKPVVLSALACAQGYDLVKSQGANDGPTVHDLGKIAQAASDIQVELAEALSDGNVCADEAKAMKPAMEHAMQVLREIHGSLTKIAEGAEFDGD